MTPLHLAVGLKEKNPEVVRVLVNGGAAIDASGEFIGTPISLAAADSDDDPEMVRLLLEYDADIELDPTGNGGALHSAAWRGNVRIAQVLLDAGADVNAVNGYSSSTPLHWGMNNHEIVQLLVTSGADVLAENENGQTPCDVARIVYDAPSPAEAEAIKLVCR